jgi:STE24 endopeptidase
LATHLGPGNPRSELTRALKWSVPATAFAAVSAVGVHLLWRTSVPHDLHLAGLDPHRFFTAHELERACDYERFLRINAVLSVVVLVAVLVLYARHGARFARESAAGRIGTGMLLAMLGLGIVWLAQFPFGLAQLWWERRHDISRQGYVDWILSSWFGLAGVFLSISIAVLIVMALAGVFRNRWWLPAAPAFVAIALLVSFVGPFLTPDLQSLRKPDIAADARRLERAERLPEIPVKVEKAKEFTTAPNAEATGLGPTRLVILWDTLLDGRFSREQIGVVLAHELGHHSRHHLWKGIGWSALFALPTAFMVAAVTRRRGGLHRPEAVPLALLAVVVLQLVTLPLQNVVTRRYEAEADWVALETTHDPVSARALFRKLAQTSLEQPRPPAWSYLLFEDHPTIIQRIAMVDAWQARQGAAKRELGRRSR